MGWCQEFGAQIKEGCTHPMVAGSSSCSCPDCGTVCTGKFDGCAAVWQLGPTPVTFIAAPVVDRPHAVSIDAPLTLALESDQPSTPNGSTNGTAGALEATDYRIGSPSLPADKSPSATMWPEPSAGVEAREAQEASEGSDVSGPPDSSGSPETATELPAAGFPSTADIPRRRPPDVPGVTLPVRNAPATAGEPRSPLHLVTAPSATDAPGAPVPPAPNTDLTWLRDAFDRLQVGVDALVGSIDRHQAAVFDALQVQSAHARALGLAGGSTEGDSRLNAIEDVIRDCVDELLGLRRLSNDVRDVAHGLHQIAGPAADDDPTGPVTAPLATVPPPPPPLGASSSSSAPSWEFVAPDSAHEPSGD